MTTSSTPVASPPVALITGAGSGIGAATALRFAKEGWDVVLVGRRLTALEATATAISNTVSTARPTAASATSRLSNRPSVTVFALDVAASDSKLRTETWMKDNPTIASRITAIVHNAGIVERTSTLASTDQSWHQTFETNVFAVIRLTQALFPSIQKNKGAIVNVASTLGLRPILETAAYSASKAALINWTQGFAKEVGPLGVRVNCVCPGIVDTPIQSFHSAPDREAQLKAMASLQPLGRIGKPEEVAHMIWTLAGPGSEWTTGAIVTVDGGINL